MVHQSFVPVFAGDALEWYTKALFQRLLAMALNGIHVPSALMTAVIRFGLFSSKRSSTSLNHIYPLPFLFAGQLMGQPFCDQLPNVTLFVETNL